MLCRSLTSHLYLIDCRVTHSLTQPLRILSTTQIFTIVRTILRIYPFCMGFFCTARTVKNLNFLGAPNNKCSPKFLETNIPLFHLPHASALRLKACLYSSERPVPRSASLQAQRSYPLVAEALTPSRTPENQPCARRKQKRWGVV